MSAFRNSMAESSTGWVNYLFICYTIYSPIKEHLLPSADMNLQIYFIYIQWTIKVSVCCLPTLIFLSVSTQ